MISFEERMSKIPEIEVVGLDTPDKLDQVKFRVDQINKYRDSQSARFDLLDKKAGYCLKFSLTSLSALTAYLYASYNEWSGGYQQWLALAALIGYSLLTLLALRAIWPFAYSDPGLLPDAFLDEDVVALDYQQYLIHWTKCINFSIAANDQVAHIKAKRNKQAFIGLVTVPAFLAALLTAIILIKQFS